MMDSIQSQKMFNDFVNEVKSLFDERGIKRKYTGEPYWKHLENVTNTVEIYLNRDTSLWTLENMSFHIPLRFIAYGHDVFEDIDDNYEFESLKWENYYPSECNIIIQGIRHLTDVYTKNNYPFFNREQRKLLEANRLSHIPLYAMYVKLADLLDNTKDILDYDTGFGIKYLKEKAVILKLMSHNNYYISKTFLYKDCYSQVQKFASELKIKDILL